MTNQLTGISAGLIDSPAICATCAAAGLELFRLDAGRYPTPEEGLDALMKQPAEVPIWNGPYMGQASGLIDPWGNPYRFKSPGDNGEIDVFSYGSDNAPGGTGEAKDVGNW